MAILATILTGLAVSAAVRAGKNYAQEKGWLPAAHYHGLATEAMARGNLEEAVFRNAQARRRNAAYRPALAQRDMLGLAVARRIGIAREALARAQDASAKAANCRIRAGRRRWKISSAVAAIGAATGWVVALHRPMPVVAACLGGATLLGLLCWLLLTPGVRRSHAALRRAEADLGQARQVLERQKRNEIYLN